MTTFQVVHHFAINARNSMDYFYLGSDLHPRACYNFLSRSVPFLGLLQSFYWTCCRASIAVNLFAYMYRVSWLNATTRVFIIQLPYAIHLTYHHVFYVKPSMSQTPKLRFHVFENISSVMNI
jgi:hypothetical protein